MPKSMLDEISLSWGIYNLLKFLKFCFKNEDISKIKVLFLKIFLDCN